MHPRRREELIALISGASMTLAFAPLNLFPVSIVATACLFGLWLDASTRRAAWLGFIFGVAMFGTGVSWIFVSMHNFGNMVSPLAALATVLFAALMALYLVLVGVLQSRYVHLSAPVRLLLVMPLAWTTFEWLRGWLFTGFSWLNLGDSQQLAPLAGFASWFGVYFVTLAAAVSAGLLVIGFRQGWRKGWRCGVVLAAIWLLGGVAGAISWVEPAGKPVRVALVQGNVPLTIKWDPRYRDTILELYLNLSRGVTDSDLVVWPEGALPLYLDQLDTSFERKLERMAWETKTDFLFGVVDRKQVEGRTQYYNAVASFGSHRDVYHKRHLVPFGEYPPIRPVFAWLLDAMNIPMSDFSAGHGQVKPLLMAGQRVGVSICYETAFAQEIIKSLPEATLLANVSENAWFGDSMGPHQLLQMTRMRAMETGRPIVRADNAGLSAVIDHRGKLIAVSPQFKQSIVQASVQPMTGATPYVRLGNWPILLVLLAGLIVVEWRRYLAAKDHQGKTP